MDGIYCDPGKYPECCWTHKRESIIKNHPIKYYCRKCNKYHLRSESNHNRSKSHFIHSSNKSKHINIILNDIPFISDINIKEIELDVSEFIKQSPDKSIDNSNDNVKNNINNQSASNSSSIIPDIEEVSNNKETKYKDESGTILVTFKESPRKLVRSHVNANNKFQSITKYSLDDYKILDKIGRGGFASVHLCESPDKQIYALKKIDGLKSFRKYRGTPCLMEASILASYKHDNLASAICTGSKPDGLYMVMELAKCDLSGWRHKNIPTEKLLRTISYQIIQALDFMRSEKLIHGDIKCSNILVYNEDVDNFQIRLSDFNLSSHEDWKSNLKVCTSTYKPIEVLRGDQWNEKIDIWSLGCTLYELKYRSGFMHHQGDRARQEYINAIFDWQKIINTKSNPRYYSIPYKKFTISRRRLYDKSAYNKLMFKTLAVEPEDRPSTEDLINDRYYQGLTKSFGKRYKKLDNQDIYDDTKLSVLRNNLTKYSSDPLLLDLATKIYSRYINIHNDDNDHIRLVCVWIARKMIRQIDYDINIPLKDKDTDLAKQLFELEREICNKMGFRLHLH